MPSQMVSVVLIEPDNALIRCYFTTQLISRPYKAVLALTLLFSIIGEYAKCSQRI